MYQNVRGLRTKTKTFFTNVLTSNYDIIAITESGLNGSINDGEIIPPTHKILRCDRADGRKQGGVFLAVSSRFEMSAVPIDNVDTALFEIFCAKIYHKCKLLCLCCVVYIPPKCDSSEYMHLFRILEMVCIGCENVIVVGDFNLPSSVIEVQNYFQYVSAFCGSRQANNVSNINNRTLDLVLTKFMACDLEVRMSDEPLLDVDVKHPPLDIKISVSPGQCKIPKSLGDNKVVANSEFRNVWNLKKCNFTILYERLQTLDWTPLYDIKNMQVALNYFYKELMKS